MDHNHPPGRRVPVRRASASTLSDGRLLLSTWLIGSATKGLDDLRVQVSVDKADYFGNSSTSSSTDPLIPVFFRERVLDEEEILENLIDARTGHVYWTSHRPRRGWYMFLSSPALPLKTTIRLRPTQSSQSSPSTQLVLSVRSQVATQLAMGLNATIEEAAQCRLEQSHETTVRQAAQQEVQASAARITSVTSPDPEALDATHARTSSRSAHVMIRQGTEGHSRKRSVGGPHSPNIGLGNVGGRQRVLAEASLHAQREGGPSTSRSLPKIDISRSLGSSSNSAFLHSPQPTSTRSQFDRPYSPIEEHVHLPAPPAPAASAETEAPVRESLPCTFVVVDDVGGAPSLRGFLAKHHNAAQNSRTLNQEAGGTPKQQDKPSHSRLSWTRYLWTLVPSPIRPALSFDTGKSFRIVWVDAPRLGTASPTAPTWPTNRQQSGPSSDDGGAQIEVLRFEDTSGFWFWQPHTSGRLILHEEAVRAIGVDRKFWFAVALSYLGFVEEKDGYFAAMQA
ncbi:hypothetical protein K437DRAFT_273538 [Tilletiaria anomala UBC 951]|uniref:Uncharacterized protein n=1 Tax=Tilletiaria anomala (strain ATCC 24038 / CBS 436.72 / UBC 951) TaxID=1037660 RepID=A0A066WB06_TILAU|nr:uncharacterized protein K437DRAFT_273538 [Tilletiaria anomala UBC 951]KDN47950.1 hypothetical protein K437DRAFT_273538 [Tilletiaria anomala UBC 951]